MRHLPCGSSGKEMDLPLLIIQAWCAHMRVWDKEVLVLDVCHQKVIEYPSSALCLSFFSRDILWQNGRKHEAIPYAIVAEYKLITAATPRDAHITRQEEKKARHCMVPGMSIHTAYRTPGLYNPRCVRKKRNWRKVGCFIIIFHFLFVCLFCYNGVDLSGSLCLIVYYFCLSSLRIRTSAWWTSKGNRHHSVASS